MEYVDKNSATRSLRWYKLGYMSTLALPIVLMVLYALYSLFYSPVNQLVLLNNLGAVYQGEDLSETSYSEGELKQEVADTLVQIFNYDYLDFAKEARYRKRLSGEDTSDLPDHRDKLRAFMSDGAYQKVVNKLINSPWQADLYRYRRNVNGILTRPPVKSQVVGGAMWDAAEDGRLRAVYTGFMYVLAKGHGQRLYRYQLDYSITMERKPPAVKAIKKEHYFAPLVPLNTSEWEVVDFEWTAEERG
jgi:hypothetical protein